MSKFFLVFGLIFLPFGAHAQFLQGLNPGQSTVDENELPDWQKHMRWAWNNWDAGGACNCVQLYFALGVPQYVAAGGRAGVMRQAAAVAQVNQQYAFQLVLLTQCHNAGAQDTLLTAGQQRVIEYLSQLAITQTLQ